MNFMKKDREGFALKFKDELYEEGFALMKKDRERFALMKKDRERFALKYFMKKDSP